MQLRRQREVNVFNISMLDVIASALGAILVVLIVVLSQKGAAEDKARQSEARAQQSKAELENCLYNSGFNLPLNLVFVLDISGSMRVNPDETLNHKMDEVRASLKLLLATLGENRRIDIVVFPAPEDKGHYAAFWGKLTPLTDATLQESFQKLDSLEPAGGTPTRAVLHYALGHPGYGEATGLVFLSDGIPGRLDDLRQPDDINDLLASLATVQRGVQINTIGVGLEENPEAEDFMKRLASQFNGFYLPL